MTVSALPHTKFLSFKKAIGLIALVFSVMLTFGQSPTIDTQPSATPQSVCISGATTNLTVAASTSAGTITSYVWYSNSSSSNIGGTLVATHNISSGTDSYTPSSSVAGTLYYYVIVTNSLSNTVTSNVSGAVVINPLPSSPGTISGTSSVCPGDYGVGYNLGAPIPNASSIVWSSPSSSAIASGQGTTAITVNYWSGAISGNILVKGTNSCGDGPSSAFAVTVNPLPGDAGSISGSNQVCQGQSAVTYSVPVISNATGYVWALPGGATIASGNNTNSITVNYSPTATSGDIRVYGTNSCGNGAASNIVAITVNPTPVMENSGTAVICSGESPNISLTSSVPSNFAWTLGSVSANITGASAGSGGSINQVLTNTSNTASGNVEYIVTPTSTGGGCAGTPFTINVTVNPAPRVTTSATATVCSGSAPTINLDATIASSFTWVVGNNPGSISGATSGSGNTISQTLTNPSHTLPGNVEYIVTPTANGTLCVGTPFRITVTVNPAPVVTNSPTALICSGSDPGITLTSSVASGFSWDIGTITGSISGSGPGTGGTIGQTLTNLSNSLAGSVEYNVTPTATTGTCPGVPFKITVTVNPAPVVTTANTATVCSGSSPNIALTASIPSSFTWTIGTNTGAISGASAGGGSTINQTLTNPSNSTTGSVVYIVTPRSSTGSCNGDPYNITVNVNPAPTVTTPTTKTICSGSNTSIGLTSSIASSFTWTIGTITGGITGATSGNGNSISQILTNPSSSSSGTVVYNVVPTSSTGSCVGPTTSITVTVNPAPSVTNAPTAVTCSGDGPNITLTSSIGSAFAWTVGTITGNITGASNGSGGTIDQTLSNPSNAATGTVQYLVTPTASSTGCIGAAFPLTVTVDPIPAVTTASTATICSGSTTNIALSATTPSTFSWTLGTNSGSITGATAGSGTSIIQTLANPSNTAVGSIQYIVTPTSTTGSCIGTPYTITVFVNPGPAVTTVDPAAICSGTSPNLTLSATLPSTFTWTVGTITNGITGASSSGGAILNQILDSPTSPTGGTVQYMVSATSTSGSCTGSPSPIVITVTPTPVVTTSATKSICSGTSTGLTLTASVPSSFVWTVGTITGSITGASGGSGGSIAQTLTNPGNVSAGTVEYIVTPTATTGGCVGTPYSITVTVNPIPSVSTANAFTVCSTNSPNIALGATAASTFTWTIGAISGGITGASAGFGPVINQTLTNPSATTPGIVPYVVIPTSAAGGCTGPSFTINVTVNPSPVLTSANTATICSGASPNLTLTSSGTAPFSYTWTIGTITGGITGASTGSGSAINQVLSNSSNSTPGSVEYLVTPTSAEGTCAVFPVLINVNPTPTVTNSPTASVCSGSTTNIALTASVPSNFSWTIGTITGSVTGASDASGASISQTLTNPSSSTVGTVEYWVTPTSTSTLCSGSPFLILVSVGPAPAITTPLTAATCSGVSPNISLTASAQSSYVWTVGTITGSITGATPGSGSSINQVLTNPSNATAGTVSYVVTPTSLTGCAGTTSTIVVTVNPKPRMTTLSTKSICSGSAPNILLEATMTSTFGWTVGTITGNITGATGGTGTSINQTLTNPSNATAGTVEYIVTPTGTTAGTCQGDPYSIIVTVNPKPIVTTLSTAEICSGQSTAIALTASTPSNFAWVDGTIIGGVTGASDGTGPTISQVLTYPGNSSSGSVEYIVTPTSVANSCAGTPFTILVKVDAVPVVTAADAATICSGTSPNIALSATTPSTFTWILGTVSGGITGASASSGPSINQTLTNPSSTLTGSVQYIVTPRSNSGSCTGAPYTITVTVSPKPAVTTANTKNICSGDVTNISLTSSVTSSFTWTVGTITGSITGASAGSGTAINQTLTNPDHNLSGVVEYIVTPTATAGGLCVGDPYSIFVTVNPTPIISTPPTAIICSGATTSISLTSSVASTFAWTIGTVTGGITGASAASGSVISQTLTNPLNSSPGYVEYIVTPTSSNGCVGTPFVITVTVNPVPVVTTSNTATICSGTSPNIALSASSSSNFTWTVGTISGGITGATAGSGDFINQILTNPSSISSGSVQYRVTPTAKATGSCAGAPYTITVNVNPSPSVTTLGAKTICSGVSTNISLTSSAASTFAWTIGAITGGITGASGSTGSSINQTLSNASHTTAGTVVYNVTPTSTGGGCAGPSFPITVTVNAIPIVTSSPTAAICSGETTSIALTSSAPCTFSWTRGTIIGGITGSSDGSGSTISQTLVNPDNTDGSVEYIVTPTSIDGSCVGNPFVITVTVHSSPVVTTSNTFTICSGANPNIALTADVPSSFSWTIGSITGGVTGASANSGSTINQILTNPSSSGIGSVQYIVTPTSTNGSCVGTPYLITVTVNPAPAVTNAATATICSGTSPNINLTATVGSSFTWTVGSINGGITGASANTGTIINQVLVNPSNTNSGSVQYIVTPTATSGSCPGSPYTITVTVLPKPVVTNTSTANTCSGTSPNISLTASIPSTFTWTVGSITGSVTGASDSSGSVINQVLTNPDHTVAGTVAYIVTPTSVSGSCIGTPFTLVVTVDPAPQVTSPATATICSGTSTNIVLSSSAPSTFTWTVGANVGGITGASSGSGNTITQVLSNPGSGIGTIEYLVTPTSVTGSCAGAPYSIVVTVNPAPAVTTSATATTCSGSSPNITLTASLASTYTWTIGTIIGGITGATASAGPSINQTLVNPSNSVSGSVQYIVTPTATSGSCIGAPYSITVTVLPKPVVTSAPTAVTCSGSSPDVALTSSIPSSFTWAVGTITGSITGASSGSGSTINQILVNPSNSAAGTVAYIVTPTSTSNGCVGIPYTVTVTVNPAPVISTANTASTCSGTSPNIALSASVLSSFSWTIGTISGSVTGASASSGSTINQVLTNPSSLTAGTVEYIVTPVSSNGSCTGTPKTITVTVNPAPVVTNSSTATICSDTSPNISLTASSASNFAWTIGAISGNVTGASAGSGSTINQVLSNPSNSASGTVQYIITPTASTGSCPGTPFTLTVTVLPKPILTNAPTATVCNGSGPNITLTSSIPSTYSWTIGAITGSVSGASGGSGSSINQVLTNSSNTISGTVAYIITPTSISGSCTGTPFTITVTVLPAPAVTTPSTKVICSGASPDISLTASIPSNFSWTVGTITGGISGASSGTGATISQVLSNPSNTSAGSVNYLVTPVSQSGSCIGSPYTITVTVNPGPAVTTPSTATICGGSSPNISLTATITSGFAWTIGTITGGVTGASSGSGATINQTLVNPGNSVAGTVQYIVTPTAVTGSCSGAPSIITVTVLPKPTVTNAPTMTTCNGTSPNISLTASVPSSFTWVVGDITGGITGAGDGSGSSINQVLTNPSNTNAGTVAYIITPTSTAGSCTGIPFVLTVTVNPTPVISTGSTATTCSGTSPNISLTASLPSSFSWTIGTISGGITGASAGSGSSINQVLTNPNASSAGSVQYIVTPTSSNGSCVGAAKTITVTVNPAPVVTNTNSTICSGTSPAIGLTGSVASSFTWTVGTVTGNISGATAGSGATIDQVLTNPSNTASGTVSYIVTPTATSNSCAGIAGTIVVTVLPKPIITNAPTAVACNGTGANIALSASVPSNFSWTVGSITGSVTGASSGSGSTINQVLTNPSNSISGTVDYIVTPTSIAGSCIGNPFTITVSVRPAPTVTNAATAVICSGNTPNIGLTASLPSNFTWTVGTITGSITGASAGSGGTINQVLTNPSSTSAGSVQYIVTPTTNSGSCTGAPYTITVTVNPAPSILTSQTATICSGNSPNISLTASSASTYTWTIGTITGGITGASAGSGTSINQVLTNPGNALPGTVQYLVTATSTTGSCSGAPYSIVVTVNPIPVLLTANSASVCSGKNVSINLISSTASSFAWTIGTVTGSITGATAGSGSTINQVLTNPSSVTAGIVTYLVTPTSSTGTCVGATYPITVTVNPTTFLTSAHSVSVCSDSPFNYTPVPSTAGTICQWNRALTNGISNPSASGVGDPNETLINTTSYPVNVTYVYTLTYGGCSSTENVVVTVNPKPVLSSSLTLAPLCNNGVFSYTPASLTNGATYTWIRPTIPGITNPQATGTGAVNEVLQNSTSAPITVTYIYTLTANGCSNTQNVSVEVGPSPVLTSTLTPTPICSNSVFSYIPASTSSGVTFSWTRAAVTNILNPSASGTGNPNEILYNSSSIPVPVTYVFTLAVAGCSSSTTYDVVVIVNPTPTLSNSPVNPPPICSGSLFSYTPASSTVGASFTWNRASLSGIAQPGNFGSGNVSEYLSNTTALPIDVTYTYTTSLNGCSSTKNVVVRVNPAPALSSSLTPPPVCTGSTFNYVPTSLTPGATFTWTRAAVAGISGSQVIPVIGNVSEVLNNSTAAPVEVTYNFTVTANGCSNPVPYSVKVFVYPIPAKPVISPAGPLRICEGTSTTLTSTVGYSYLWSNGATTRSTDVSSAGNYFVVVINEGGCQSTPSDAVAISINPAPAPPTSGGDIKVCDPPTQNLIPVATPPAGAKVEWFDASTGGTLIASPSWSTIGTKTFYGESVNLTTGCRSLTRTAVSLTILVHPEAPTGSDITVCETGLQQTLRAVAVVPNPFTVKWYNAAGNLVTNPILTGVGSIDYYAEADNGTCASLTRTKITLTILPAPAAPVSTGTATKCAEATIIPLYAHATATGASAIRWYTSPTGGTPLALPAGTEPFLDHVGTVTYYAEAFDGTCTSLTRSAPVVLTINPTPARPVTILPEDTQCEANPIRTLTATATATGATINWYNAAVGGAIVSSPTLSNPGTVTYYAEAVIGSCNSPLPRTAVKLTINPAPAPPVASKTEISECDNGQTIIATATVSSGETMVWFTAATGGVAVATPTQTGVGSTTYYAEARNSLTDCRSLTRTAVKLTISGTPLPPVPGIPDPTNPAVGVLRECASNPLQTLTATATSPEGYDIKWYRQPAGGAPISSPTLNSIGTVDYYAEAASPTCGSSTRVKFTLEIYAVPNAPTALPTLVMCASDPQIATGNYSSRITPAAGYGVEWFNGQNDLVPLDHVPTFSILQVGTTTYYAGSVNQVTGCRSLPTVRTAVKVTINPTPNDPVRLNNGNNGDITECVKTPVQVIRAAVEAPTDGSTIVWYDAAVGGNIVTNPTLNFIGTKPFWAEAKLGTCVSKSRVQVKLTLVALPLAPKPLLTNKVTICESELPYALSKTLQPIDTTSFRYKWYDQNGGAVPDSLKATGESILYVETFNKTTGCSSSRTLVTVTVLTAPASPVLAGKDTINECALVPLQKLDANNGIRAVAGMKVYWYTDKALTAVIDTPTWKVVGVPKTYYSIFENTTTKCRSLKPTAVTLLISDVTAHAISNSPVQAGQEIRLNGGPKDASYSYLWTTPGGITYPTQDMAIPTAVGTDAGWYKLKVTTPLGCTSTDSTKVFVGAGTADYQQPVCVGGTLYLLGWPDNMKSYAWTGPDGFISADQNPYINNVTLMKAGTYTLTVTDASNKVTTGTVDVIIHSLPEPLLDANVPICKGSTLQLKGGPDGMVSYMWKGQNGAVINTNTTIPDTSIPNYSTAPETFTLTVIDKFGCEATKSIQTSYFKPKVSFQPVCVGDTLRLKGEPSGMRSYTWKDPNSTIISSLQSPMLIGAKLPGKYTLTVVDQSGCIASADTNVVFKALPPTPIITANMNPICAGNNLTLAGDPPGMVKYLWTGPSGFNFDVQNPPSINAVTKVNAGLYTLKITNSSGCSATSPITIIVNSATFNGTYGPYCINDAPVTLSATPSGGTFIGQGIVGANANIFDPKTAGVGSHHIIYNYTLTNASGTCDIRQPIDIIVTDNKNMIQTNTVILASCTGSTADLTLPEVTAGSAPGLVFTYWKDSAGKVPLASPNSVGAGIYYIKGATPSGKCFEIQPVLVGQPDLLKATLVPSGELKCAGDTTGTLTVNVTLGTAPYTYQWSTKPSQTAATAVNLRAGIYTVVVSDASGCTSSFTGEIKEPDPIKLGFEIKPVQCLSDVNGSARVDTINGSTDVNILNSYKYRWATNPVQTTREAVRLSSLWHTVTLTNENGCIHKDSVFVKVLDVTPPTITCPKDIDLTLQYIKSDDGSPNKYTIDLGKPVGWDNCAVDTITNDSPVKFRTGLTYVIWTVADQVGLLDTCTQRISIKEIPIIPQLISPNGDGVNDKLLIDGLEQFPNTQLLIFTRSGQLVFQSDNYELQQNAWDGKYSESTFNKNSLVAPGVYYYILKLGGSSGQSLKGYVYVYY